MTASPTPQSVLSRNNVQVIGNPQAQRDLVFVHGFGTDQTFWRLVTPAFEQTHRIVLLDNVGAGGSDPAAFAQDRYLSLDHYAADLLEVMDALELRQPAVVGHSSGGMIAAIAAVQRPGLLSKLVLVGASARYLDDGAYIGGMTQADRARIYSAMMANFSHWAGEFADLAVNAPEQPDLAREFARTLTRIEPKHALTVLYSILHSDLRDMLPKIAVPTLVVQSREDFFVPPQAAMYLYAHIPGSRMVGIDARGHFPHLSAPAEVIRVLRDFLSPGLSPPAAS